MNAHSSIAHLPSAAASSASSHGTAKAHRGDAGPFADHLDGTRTPPAQAARAALEDRPDLAARPFGAIVSLLARNEELPAAVDAGSGIPPAPDETADVPEESDAAAPL